MADMTITISNETLAALLTERATLSGRTVESEAIALLESALHASSNHAVENAIRQDVFDAGRDQTWLRELWASWEFLDNPAAPIPQPSELHAELTDPWFKDFRKRLDRLGRCDDRS